MTFGRLSVLEDIPGSKNKHAKAICLCACGQTHVVERRNLINGKIKSCGCLNKELVANRSTTHGQTKGRKVSGTYKSWAAMIQRTTNPKHDAYLRYGGRGIKICKRWLKFENFFADMGERPTGKTLDRFPNNAGNYEPGNTRWATYKEQANNKRKRT